MSKSFGQLSRFAHVSLVDFEFRSLGGERPDVVCMVVKDCRSGRVERYWQNELYGMRSCPFPNGPEDLMVAYYASAEISCILELGWQPPQLIIDLFAEHRVQTNGPHLPLGNSLVGALVRRGLPHIDAAAKEALRTKIINQTSWSPQERIEILNYCESDVEALSALLTAMLPDIDVPRALLRGRYTKAVGHMERAGVPVDIDIVQSFRENWTSARWELAKTLDKDFSLFEGLKFKQGRFNEWLRIHKIPWPRTETGALKLDDETFKERAAIWPVLKPLRELRQALNSMHLTSLPIGGDGRNRTLLAPFASKTGRNQPSAKRFVYALAAWQRGVIKPSPGWGLGYVDFASQEIGIAAGLSGDVRLIAAYESGDCYLGFGKQTGLVPLDANRATHPALREICKTVMLGLNYGLGAENMALQARISPALAAELIQRHRSTYPRYWRWIEGLVTASLLTNEMSSIFGWRRTLVLTAATRGHRGKAPDARFLPL